ncbi:unnamed protein product, partial [Rotaria magnacalcarata]
VSGCFRWPFRRQDDPPGQQRSMKSKNSVRKNNFHPNDHSTPKTKFNPDNILYKEPNQPINIIDNDNKQINDNINKNQLELTSIQSNSNSSKKLFLFVDVNINNLKIFILFKII